MKENRTASPTASVCLSRRSCPVDTLLALARHDLAAVVQRRRPTLGVALVLVLEGPQGDVDTGVPLQCDFLTLPDPASPIIVELARALHQETARL